MATELNSDFSIPAHADTANMPWQDSPQSGVQRRMLDRIGDEVARATSLVRFEAGAVFPRHVHELGEEFFVLWGVFEDSDDVYPAGTYARHPPGSSHAPWSKRGCVLLVKLRQFDPADDAWVKVNTRSEDGWVPDSDGNRRLALHSLGAESVWAVEVTRQSTPQECPGGAELYVLEGDLQANGQPLATGSWLRLPPGATLSLAPGTQTARVWMKLGHLGAR